MTLQFESLALALTLDPGPRLLLPFAEVAESGSHSKGGARHVIVSMTRCDVPRDTSMLPGGLDKPHEGPGEPCGGFG